MTIMFQLFSARDLQMLTANELDELKYIAITAMNDTKNELRYQDYQMKLKNIAETRRRVSTQFGSDPGIATPPITPPTLGIGNNIDPLPETSSQMNSILKKRLNEVRQQLLGSRESAPYGQDSFNKAIESQSTSDTEPKLDTKERTILQWALSCERNFLEFYAPLRRARDMAHKYFLEKTGQRPEGPDSSYSPFSPDHPLRRRSSGLYDY
jgi:hypothetical protein